MGLAGGIRKHPVITAASIILALTVLWGGYFLSTFDLNDYRRQLQAGLEERLSIPVRFGHTGLRLRDAGIAVSFSDVAIGDKSSSFSLETRELWLLLEWSALFHRQLRFSKIGLAKPVIHLESPSPTGPGSQKEGPTAALLVDSSLVQGLNIRTLEISDGSLRYRSFSGEEKTDLLVFDEIDAQITDLAPGRDATLNLAALLRQPDRPAVLKIDGTAALPTEFAAWAAAAVDVNIEISSLDGATTGRVISRQDRHTSARGIVDLTARFVGSLEKNLTFGFMFDSPRLDISSTALAEPYPLQHFQADGVLRREDDRYRFENLAINLDGMRLAGEASLQRKIRPRLLDISLTQGSLPTEVLLRLLPMEKENRLRPEASGSLWIEGGILQFEIDSWQKPVFRVDGSHLALSAEDLAWQVTPELRAELTALQLKGDGRTWKLRGGTGVIGPAPFSLEGVVTLPADAAAGLDLLVQGTIEAAEAQALLSQSTPPALKLSGPVPGVVKLTGTAERLNVDVELQLDEIEMNYADRIRLPPEPESRLSLHGILTGENFEISHAHLQHNPFAGRISGSINWSDKAAAKIRGLLEISDAAPLHNLAPALEPLHISGTANLDFSLEGPLDNLHRQAVLTLHDLGFSTRGITGDVSRMQGKVHLKKRGFETGQLLARIGESQVSLRARVEDFADPILLLDIQARKIRADELIFPSDQVFLHDLDGQLKISADRIDFSPVHVRLPDGTRASINGRATVRPQLDADLDISSDFTDIREVISLWTRLSPQAREKRDARRQARSGEGRPYQVTIRARAAQGNLYGMHFQNAVATIVQRPGQLLVHPLDFVVDEGSCTAQVIVDFKGSGQSLLRVSGHAQDIDAYGIYNELLNQKSILRGSLSGNFYLQGQLGANYLPSSYGHFDVEIKDGVLRQFHILSKIFSLLNVSQIFSLKLPDMDREGMPFDKISGSLAMNSGILSSEKLLVKSEAMNQSYVGKLDLIEKQVDFTLAIQPLGTVDKILTRIPVAGWLLTGKEKALITTHFGVRGDIASPQVEVLPVTSISEKTLGLIRRTLGLPLKLVTDPSILWGGSGEED